VRRLLHADLVDDLLEQNHNFVDQLAHFLRPQLKRLHHDEIERHEHDIDLV